VFSLDIPFYRTRHRQSFPLFEFHDHKTNDQSGLEDILKFGHENLSIDTSRADDLETELAR
jgi:hypothetical protein